MSLKMKYNKHFYCCSNYLERSMYVMYTAARNKYVTTETYVKEVRDWSLVKMTSLTLTS